MTHSREEGQQVARFTGRSVTAAQHVKMCDFEIAGAGYGSERRLKWELQVR